MSVISKYHNILTLENSLFLVLKFVFESHHNIELCFVFLGFVFFFCYYIFSIPSQLMMITNQDTLEQKQTVVLRLEEPGKEKVHLYPSTA